jgi:hypothetical protein
VLGVVRWRLRCTRDRYRVASVINCSSHEDNVYMYMYLIPNVSF